MNNKIKTQDQKLDAEEKTLLESFERGEWHSVKNVKKEIKRMQLAAFNYLKNVTTSNN